MPRSRFLVAGAMVLLLLLAAVVGRPLVQRQLTNRQPIPVAGRLLLPTDAGLVV